MNVQVFQANRNRFSVNELLPYNGQWVAFSSDGSRIVASAAELARLNDLIAAAGEDPESVGLERIQLGEIGLGSGELL